MLDSYPDLFLVLKLGLSYAFWKLDFHYNVILSHIMMDGYIVVFCIASWQIIERLILLLMIIELLMS